MSIDTRWLMAGVWSAACLFLAGLLLWRRIRKYQLHRRDRRRSVRRDVRRDVISGTALFLVAIGAAWATVVVLTTPVGTASAQRTFATALVLGGFLGALFVMATEEDVNGETDT